MKVLVLFGGRSGEHEVSVVSARAVADALDELEYDTTTVGISREGNWTKCDPRTTDRVPEANEDLRNSASDYDVVFPAMHGPFGEDGSIQGFLETQDVAYVGAGVTGSAICMDKAIHKTLLKAAGLPVVDFISFQSEDYIRDPESVKASIATLGFPCFVKPSRLGSSVGISKVRDRPQVPEAVERALRHGSHAIAEAMGAGREIEMAVLGGDPPQVSVPGEIIPDGEFYDYRAKYHGDWTKLVVPADIPDEATQLAGEYAIRAFRATDCEGLARVDFFWDPSTETLTVNEINSMPGLTPKSMFPKLWEASGRPFTRVVAYLLEDALSRHQKKQQLERTRAAAHAGETSPN